MDENFDSLCLALKGLSTESNKFRAKKDRRQQRSSFRDILRSVENGEFNRQRIRVCDRGCCCDVNIYTYETQSASFKMPSILFSVLSMFMFELVLFMAKFMFFVKKAEDIQCFAQGIHIKNVSFACLQSWV